MHNRCIGFNDRRFHSENWNYSHHVIFVPNKTFCFICSSIMLLVHSNNEIFSSSSVGYTLSKAVYSSENLPPFQASIKDGYAIKFDGSWHETINIFKVVQISVAGTIVSS